MEMETLTQVLQVLLGPLMAVGGIKWAVRRAESDIESIAKKIDSLRDEIAQTSAVSARERALLGERIARLEVRCERFEREADRGNL